MNCFRNKHGERRHRVVRDLSLKRRTHLNVFLDRDFWFGDDNDELDHMINTREALEHLLHETLFFGERAVQPYFEKIVAFIKKRRISAIEFVPKEIDHRFLQFKFIQSLTVLKYWKTRRIDAELSALNFNNLKAILHEGDLAWPSVFLARKHELYHYLISGIILDILVGDPKNVGLFKKIMPSNFESILHFDLFDLLLNLGNNETTESWESQSLNVVNSWLKFELKGPTSISLTLLVLVLISKSSLEKDFKSIVQIMECMRGAEA